jgi:threonine dehydratase
VRESPIWLHAHLCSHRGTMDDLSGRQLFFKSEFLQKTGSFKARGASNALFKNNYHAVVTHSSGNHGQALSWAAKKRSIPAYIVMPSTSPQCKVNAVRAYGGIVTFCEPNVAAREATSKAIMEETGAVFVHPYNDPDVMSGQGTIALELLEQIADLDAIIVPVGGGGMCSGVAMAAKSLRPSIKIIGAEPALASDASRSFKAGELVGNESPPQTIADGLKTNLGDRTWPIIKTFVDDIITVEEDEIRANLFLMYERCKTVLEPSAAVGVAVATGETFKARWGHLKRVGVILCGGNIDLSTLATHFDGMGK